MTEDWQSLDGLGVEKKCFSDSANQVLIGKLGKCLFLPELEAEEAFRNTWCFEFILIMKFVHERSKLNLHLFLKSDDNWDVTCVMDLIKPAGGSEDGCRLFGCSQLQSKQVDEALLLINDRNGDQACASLTQVEFVQQNNKTAKLSVSQRWSAVTRSLRYRLVIDEFESEPEVKRRQKVVTTTSSPAPVLLYSVPWLPKAFMTLDMTRQRKESERRSSGTVQRTCCRIMTAEGKEKKRKDSSVCHTDTAHHNQQKTFYLCIQSTTWR